MVVNRKQPAAPISRTSSTQPVPTKRPQPLPKPNTNGTERYKPVINVPSKAPPPRAKRHRDKKARKPRSFLDRLFLFSLALFAVYSFLVCRPSPLFLATYEPQPPLCHSLSAYRTHILEPYILPPITSALSYSHALAEPYIEQGKFHAEPYLAPVCQAVRKVEPYVWRAQRVASKIYHGTLAPFYKNTLKPYWLTAVVPRWNIYVKPRLVPLQRQANRYWRYYVSNPITFQYARTWSAARSVYAQHVQPVVLNVQPRVISFVSTLHRYTLHVFDIYSKHIHPRLLNAWVVSRPYLCSTYKQAKALTLGLIDFAILKGRWAVQEIGNQRRTYVDPHLLKIWEKVAEKNASKSDVGLKTTANEPPIKIEDLPETVEETVEPTLEPTSAPAVAEPTPTPTTEEPSIEDLHVNDPFVPTPEEVDTGSGMEATHDVPASPQDPVKIPIRVEQTSADAPSSTPEAKGPILEEEQVVDVPATPSVDTQTETKDENKASPASVTTSSPSGVGVGVGASQIPLKAEQQELDAEDDLDEFLKDLGVDASGSQPAQTQPSPEGPTPPESKQSEEDRLAAVAAQRLEITTRHTNWQAQLDSAVSAAASALTSRLASIREAQVKELDMEGKRVLEEVQKEGERLAKGLEGYLKKAEGRQDRWALKSGSEEESKEGKDLKKAKAKEEMGKWDVVLQKVEDKFGEKVRDVRGQVHEWYVKERGLEGDEITQSSLGIKELAERAQADIGLDYAWLEDVTYNDWQRYHDLMRTSEQYEQTAIQIQNGTSLNPPSPEDSIIPALDALDASLQEVIAGFSVLLAGLRGRAAGVFSVYTTVDGDESNGFWSVKDGESRRDDLRGVDLGGLGLGDKGDPQPKVASEGGREGDEVRILPISPALPAEKQEDFDPSHILMSKSAEQVEQALRNAPPVEDVKRRHVEL